MVVSCVNAVGVEVNTASKQLLTYVSGLNATVAENIVKLPQRARRRSSAAATCWKCRGSGDKAFEQAAGFLRIRGAANPLDESAVHPGAYAVVDRMAEGPRRRACAT